MSLRAPWALVVRAAAATVLSAPPVMADDVISDPELQPRAAAAPATDRVASAPEPQPRTAAVPATDQVISDPELQPHAAMAPATDQVISDPELVGSKPGAPAGPAASAAVAEPSRPEYPHDAVWRITLGSRWGMATDWDRPSQDVVEGTTIGLVEAEQRRSEVFLFSVGARMRHGFGMRRSGNTRTEVDVVPVSAFADITPAAGYHVRAGYQVISMGRFDVFSATNFLAVYDLRSGPVTMQGAAEIGQPALRFDFDKVSGFTLQAYYLPFYTPDIVPVYGSNYALGDRVVDAGATDETTGLPFPRSQLSTASEAAFRGFSPSPDLTTPQGAVRGTLHGSAGELSATIGTAVERLPVVGFSESEFVAGANVSPFHRDRFGVASIDGATDAGPVQIGFEAAYLMHRTLTATGVTTLPIDTGPTPHTFIEHADLAQGGLRAEIVDGSGWASEVEGMAAAALSVPSDKNLQWMTADKGRYWAGVAGGVHFAPPDAGLKFELAGAYFTGPSYLVMPRVEWEAVKTLFLELGAVFVGGPTPSNDAIRSLFAGTPHVSLGGLFHDVDQVFTGVRWVP
jgi:hypothetical protein